MGTIVRVPLHGRRVRGWIVELDATPRSDPDRLRSIAKLVSAGPPPDVVSLCEWAAWRYAGPCSSLLRAASPPNTVRPDDRPDVDAAMYHRAVVPDVVADGLSRPVSVIEWPPAVDRRELVLGLLAPEGSTIVVVPDAARVSLLARALEREGRSVLVMSGEQPHADRTALWARARAGACVVVGGRVAVFAPVPDLRAIVVLDEGDESLAEERAPAWHARELALERARRSAARVTLVSPAPTVDAIAAAGDPLRPPRATVRGGWPRVEVVDPREEPPGRGLLTERVVAAVRDALHEGGRAVSVLNRRGRARLLACDACGDLARCERCDAAVSEADEGLACPRCGLLRPRVCLHCHGTRLRVRRVGVSRVAGELARLLPRATVSEVDAARDPEPGATALVGTEAVLHRLPPGPPARLCVFLDFDQELLAPRYRAAEQALWLLARAARLVGPRSGPGRVLVQTRVRGHEVVEAARRADPGLVADAERARRRALGFPPFGGLAELSGEAGSVLVACAALRAHRAHPALEVIGPSDTPHGARALVRGQSVDALCTALAATDFAPARARGRLRVDVDPLRV